VAAVEGILGVRAEHEGLRVDPVLPADWDGFSMTRRFRGTTYRIRVEKAAGITGRVASLDVDGVRVPGNIVPLPAEPGAIVEVSARIDAA
jgi:cellobiose phosphorylase